MICRYISWLGKICEIWKFVKQTLLAIRNILIDFLELCDNFSAVVKIRKRFGINDIDRFHQQQFVSLRSKVISQLRRRNFLIYARRRNSLAKTSENKIFLPTNCIRTGADYVVARKLIAKLKHFNSENLKKFLNQTRWSFWSVFEKSKTFCINFLHCNASDLGEAPRIEVFI